MDIAMDTTNNGRLTPQPLPNSRVLSPQLSAKRKRDDSSTPSEHLSNGDTKSNGITAPRQPLSEMIADLLVVLQSQDKHAILSRAIASTDDASEPQTKRQKAESESASIAASTTILARACAGKYQSMDEVLSDIDLAAVSVSKALQLPQEPLSKHVLPIPKRELDFVMEIDSFRDAARELVQRQQASTSVRAKGQANGVSPAQQVMANGDGVTPVTQLTARGDGNVVLTLYGSASTPKQLFSSMQRSVSETGVAHPLREVGLPNGISTTHIVPAKPLDLTEERKRIPTFGELFTSSNNSLSLPHPKPSKNATTRNPIVGWYNPSAFENSKPRSASYFGQPVSTGQWLEYNSASKSPEFKRRRKDRALSLSGKPPPPPPEHDHDDDEVKQLENLFRSAYSSFAPTKDETAAVASEGTVNRIWWRHVGEKTYERFLGNSQHLDDLVDGENAPTATDMEDDELDLHDPTDGFATWVPADAIDPDLQDTPAPKSIQEKESEQVLKDISELLETLNSHQRIRNLSLSHFARPATTDAAAQNSPCKPSESEQATYEILKAQLSIMISQLPPYAVAKLNSDQLAELSISTKIPIETESYKGVMEEDEFSARAKLAAMNVASTAARVVASPAVSYTRSTPSTTTSLYGNQYGSASRGGASTSFYSQTQVRPPVVANVNNMPRASVPQPYTSQAQYSQRQTPTPGYRPAATATPTYPHQATHLSQTYGQSPTPSTYFQQTPQTQRYSQGMGSPAHSGMPNATPQAVLNGRYQPPTHQNYQQRAPISQNTASYQFSTANVPRQASPQKSMNSVYNSPQPSLSHQQQQQQQQQRNFSTPTPSQDPSRSYFQRQVSNGATSAQSYTPQRPPQAPTTNVNGVQNYRSAAGFATVMTDEEQRSMLERNQRHLAQTQGSSQYAARAAATPGLMSGSQLAGLGGGINGQVDSSTGLAAYMDFSKSAS